MAMTMACSQIAQAALLSDDFNNATSEPNPVWRFFDPYDTSPAGESTQTFDGANAIIKIPEGVEHDLWKPSANNTAPRLLQATTNTDFQFEVKFESAPSLPGQLQGIVIQENDDIFLRFDVFSDNSGFRLFVAYVNGVSNTNINYASTLLQGSPNYRQVIRSGDNWTFRYSNDGLTWETVNFIKSLTVTEVGFFAGNTGQTPSFLSSVDYFINLDAPITDVDVPAPVISTWHDYSQPIVVGRPGVSQRQTNILGNVFTDLDLSSSSYKLNDGEEQPLKVGPDTRRLQRKGDFNIEIDYSRLNEGLNDIEILARDSDDKPSSKVVTIDYQQGNIWPLPYTADWKSLSNIQQVKNIVHIVDGLWKLTPSGIRTVQTGYDRTITIGDRAWVSNYQVTVPVTFHSGFAGVGIGVGWQGFVGNRSPKLEWPLQSLAWIRGPIDKTTLEIITYGGLPTNTWENIVTPDPQLPVSITRNITYIFKISSQSFGNGMSRFNVKLWPQSETEPVAWDVSANIPSREGSIILVAHQANITFGNVSIEPLLPIPDTTPPQISNINIETTGSTATISWNTDEPSTSMVDYGLNSNFGLKVGNSTPTKDHSITLTNLQSNTNYFSQIIATDTSNNSASSQREFIPRNNPNSECTLDADGSGDIDALTDGLLFIRYLFGIRDESLVANAVHPDCLNCLATEVQPIFEKCATASTNDIDGNGEIDALTDGLLMIRYLFGIRGDALIAKSVADDCSRCTVPEIELYLQELTLF